MFVVEKQMNFVGKHSCIQRKDVILSNADLISNTFLRQNVDFISIGCLT